MYGAQTAFFNNSESLMFENDVEMYGAQTWHWKKCVPRMFENDVEMYGAQTWKSFSWKLVEDNVGVVVNVSSIE